MSRPSFPVLLGGVAYRFLMHMKTGEATIPTSDVNQQVTKSSHTVITDNSSVATTRRSGNVGSSKFQPIQKEVCFKITKWILECDSKEHIHQLCEEMSEQFNFVNISVAMHSLAKHSGRLAHNDRKIHTTWGLLKRKALAMASDFAPRNIASLFWAIATLELTLDDDLACALTKQAIVTCNEFIPQDIANLFWGLASLGVVPDSDLVRVLVRRAVATSENFKPQDVSNLLWSFATMSIEPGKDLISSMIAQAIVTGKYF